METEETKKKETTGDTEKAVSRGEFDALKSLMSKGFESVTSLISKALDVEAHDQNSPDKDKETPIGGEENTAKAEGDAMDQVNTDKAKTKEVGDKSQKSVEDGNGTDENGTREKSETEEEKEKDTTDEYKLETVERAIKSMQNLQKRIKKTSEETEEKKKTSDKEETEKAETEEEEKEKAEESEDTTMKGMHPLDAFVLTVAKTMEAMTEKMEKSGKSIPGFEKNIINTIREDAVLQEEIVKMSKIPGFKKSVSMGVPYVATKEGRRFALTMTEAGAPTIEKSRSTSAQESFKDVFKRDFSSIREGQ